MFRAKILVVDDEEGNLLALEKILTQEAFSVVVAKQAGAALAHLQKAHFDLVLTDLRMPGVSGLELLRTIRRQQLSLPVVLMTAFGTVSDAVEAMKLGAVDFLSKPLKRDQILRCVQDTLQKRAAGRGQPAGLSFFGSCGAIQQIRKTVRMLARTNAAVLLMGESGTGKEVIAGSIHAESGRQGGLICINCGAIPESLLESELFGYEKGAFTGATQAKPGLFEAAHQGTLFLDEIGDMPLPLQVKLLRVLQGGAFFRLGGTQQRNADVRIIAATNQDLQAKILAGCFRSDLFFRLNVVSIQVPPLRERGEDVPALAELMLQEFAAIHGRQGLRFASDAITAIRNHDWPGNVRELRNCIERSVVMLEGDSLSAADLGLAPSALAAAADPQPRKTDACEEILRFPVGTSLREVELEMIRRTLEFTNGDKQRAAELLGINQRTIYRKLHDLAGLANAKDSFSGCEPSRET